MCNWYEWVGKPVCMKGHKASIKCHSKHPTCGDYLDFTEAQKQQSILHWVKESQGQHMEILPEQKFAVEE